MSSFYQYARDTILIGEMPLPRMLEKLDKLEFDDKITPEEHIELANLARDHADPELSRNLVQQVDDHERRIRALEDALKGDGKLPKPEPEPSSPDEPLATDEYPAYIKGKTYYKGDKVTCNGKQYICVLNEYTESTTWGPLDYPAYWSEKEGVKK